MIVKTAIIISMLNFLAWGQYIPLTPSETYTNSHIVNPADPGIII